jgi:hypothetical protein
LSSVGKTFLSVRRVRIILLLVSVCIVLVPVGVTLAIYSGNPTGLFVPSNSNKLSSALQSQNLAAFVPKNPSEQYNALSRTFSVTFTFTNSYQFALTYDAISWDLSDNQTGHQLGHISLPSPVEVGPGESVPTTMSTTFSQSAADDVATTYAGQQSFNVNYSNMSITVCGITIEMNQFGTFPVPIVR